MTMEDGYNNRNMKRLINIITGLAVMVMAAVSCSNQDMELPAKTVDPALVGEWHLAGMKADGEYIGQDTDVYLVISEYGSFELYQKTGSQEMRYDRYSGNCWTEDGILTGVYSDGKPWGSRYEYAKTFDGFLLKSYNLLEEQKYVKAVLPEEVRTNANPVGTRSAASGSPIL